MTQLAKIARGTAAAALIALFSVAAVAAAEAIPSTPEAGTFRLGIEPWLGYGQWHIAKAKDLFAANGLPAVEIVNFNEDKDVNAALASGQLEAATIATHTAMAMIAAGLPVKIVLLLDVSMTADAIVAGKGIETIADLKGKQVAFEEGTTSDILLKYALARNGMSIADVEPVPMPASDAGSALIAGRVPVAVTYEPYLTAARNQDSNIKEIFPASEDPGLISDVLVVRDDVIASKPGQVLAMIKTWDAALKSYNEDTPGGRAIISEAVGASVEELNTAFDGVRYYSLAENKVELTGDFATKVFDDVEAAAKTAGLLQGDVSAEQLIDGDFVAAAE